VSKWLSGQSLPDQESLDDLAARMEKDPDDVWSVYAASAAAVEGCGLAL